MNPITHEMIDRYTGIDEGSKGFIVKKEMLIFRNRYYFSEDSTLIKKILQEFHNSQIGGYSGIHRTWKRIAKHFSWPNMGSHIKKYVKECLVCQHIQRSSCNSAIVDRPLFHIFRLTASIKKLSQFQEYTSVVICSGYL